MQDDSYLHEGLCSELFTAAGLVAPRVTHARVLLNGRDLGLYVLKEGVDKRFLARHFPKAKGNLYDGGFCQDVDEELQKDEGKGVDDRSDLRGARRGLPRARPRRAGEAGARECSTSNGSSRSRRSSA